MPVRNFQSQKLIKTSSTNKYQINFLNLQITNYFHLLSYHSTFQAIATKKGINEPLANIITPKPQNS